MEQKMRDPLISVIVPIYNVEKHVQKCLDSLQQQSLKQIEVIMVDDGSTDKSGVIAEQYVTQAGQWPAFRCIHTQNRGLSAARNRGIEEARAEWLMFVDSDDWVEPGFCEIPYKAANENQADIVIFKSFRERRGKIKRSKPAPSELSGSLDFFTAFEYGENAAWNKLYKKELFQDIRYPSGRVYEDIATTHKLEYVAKKIICIQDRLYCHVYRKESISHTYLEPNRRDEFISTRERYNDLILYGIPKEKHIHYMYSAAIGYLACTLPCNSEIYFQAKDIVESIQGIPQSMSDNRKIALIAWKTNKRLFYALSRISGRAET